MDQNAEKIQLHRRGKDAASRSEVTSVPPGTYDPVAIGKRALIVLPGLDAERTDNQLDRRYIAGYAAEAENLLGGGYPNPLVDIVVASYPPDSMTQLIHTQNNDPHYVDEDFRRFTQEHIIPLIEKGTPLTLLGHSAGTTAIEVISRALTEHYSNTDLPLAEISKRMNMVVAIVYGNTSGAYSLTDYTCSPAIPTILIHSPNDDVAAMYNPRFAELTPPGHIEGTLSVSQAPNLVVATTHTDVGSQVWNGFEYVNRPEHMDNHAPSAYTYRYRENPPGTVLFIEQAVSGAAMREPGDYITSDGHFDLLRMATSGSPQITGHGNTHPAVLLAEGRALYEAVASEEINPPSATDGHSTAPRPDNNALPPHVVRQDVSSAIAAFRTARGAYPPTSVNYDLVDLEAVSAQLGAGPALDVEQIRAAVKRARTSQPPESLSNAVTVSDEQAQPLPRRTPGSTIKSPAR